MNQEPNTTRRVFDGRLIQVDVLEFEATGRGVVRREVVRHPGAVAIWAQTAEGRYVFVRQYREPARQELLEVVAGTLNPGEDPRECAIRELKEETGYRVRRIEALGSFFSAPGFCDEQLHVFYAELESQPGAQQPDPDEVLEVVLIEPRAFEAMLKRGEIIDGKTWVAWAMVKAR